MITDITQLDEHAAEIRRLGKRVIGDIIEIGRRLSESKKLCGHGNWLPWLEREFGWTEQTALNFMRVHELGQSKSKTILDLNLPVRGLYLLAAPSTPEEARADVIELAETGEKMTHARIKEVVERAKKPASKPKSESEPATVTAPAEMGKQVHRKVMTKVGHWGQLIGAQIWHAKLELTASERKELYEQLEWTIEKFLNDDPTIVLTADALRSRADALEREAQAKRRLADEREAEREIIEQKKVQHADKAHDGVMPDIPACLDRRPTSTAPQAVADTTAKAEALN